jgi:hypothetical protein
VYHSLLFYQFDQPRNGPHLLDGLTDVEVRIVDDDSHEVAIRTIGEAAPDLEGRSQAARHHTLA